MLATLLATAALVAPSLSISGTTLHWNAVGEKGYTVNAKAAGLPTTNTRLEATTTSFAPPAEPGATVTYRVKARGVPEWSNTVTIAWPGGKQPPPPPPTLPGGINAGTEPLDLTGVSTLHAKIVRIPFNANEASAPWLLEWDKRFAEVGATLQPVALFDGRMLSAAEAKGLVALDKLPGLRDVELGNETSFGYQYNDGYTASSYRERARTYAVRVREVAEALTPHGIGVLAQAEDGGSGSPVWVDEMFAAVPKLSSYVAGWTIHPYPNQRKASQQDTYGVPKMERMVADLAAFGDTTTPIAITEWGVSNDEGAALDDNASLTSAEAATIAETTIPKLIAAAGRHPIQSFLVYQVRDQREPGVDNSHEHYFGALTHRDGSKGAYSTEIERLLAE